MKFQVILPSERNGSRLFPEKTSLVKIPLFVTAISRSLIMTQTVNGEDSGGVLCLWLYHILRWILNHM